jgi:hypothetical protein
MIERFDPYGNTINADGDMMDKILKEELCSTTKMSYCGPDCYFPVAGFQTISDENNLLNQKMGDFGGYCLAWCFWYVEHKLNNMNVEPKDLIRKTMNRFMSMKIKPMEYIRNYANYINKYRVDFLKKIGIPENMATNEHFSKHDYSLLEKALIKYHQ